MGPNGLRWNDRSLYRQRAVFSSPSGFLGFDFDSTLGFPGEGPRLVFFCLLCPSFVCWPWTPAAHFAMVTGCDAMLLPRHIADIARQAKRQTMPPLPKGRPVLPVTSQNRVELFAEMAGFQSSGD